MHALDIYGHAEVSGPEVAQECAEAKDGLHIWADHSYQNPRSADRRVSERAGAARASPLKVLRGQAVASELCDYPSRMIRPTARQISNAATQQLP